MNDSEIRQRIFKILHRIAPEANLDSFDANQNLREGLDIDSFDFLKVVIGINDQFGVNIPESDYRQVATLAGLVDYIKRKG